MVNSFVKHVHCLNIDLTYKIQFWRKVNNFIKKLIVKYIKILLYIFQLFTCNMRLFCVSCRDLLLCRYDILPDHQCFLRYFITTSVFHILTDVIESQSFRYVLLWRYSLPDVSAVNVVQWPFIDEIEIPSFRIPFSYRSQLFLDEIVDVFGVWSAKKTPFHFCDRLAVQTARCRLAAAVVVITITNAWAEHSRHFRHNQWIKYSSTHHVDN